MAESFVLEHRRGRVRLSAYAVGVERGYVTPEPALERTLDTLRFSANAPTGPEPGGRNGHRGFFYHFLDMQSGRRYQTTELSTIDTALIIAGALSAGEYSIGATPERREIRRLADSLHHGVEWKAFQVQSPLVTMAWRPETGSGRRNTRGTTKP